MKILIIVGIIVFPLFMLYLKRKRKKSQLFFNIIAVISAVIFGSIASISIYQIIIDDAVFMTTIHSVFLNPLFLITGAYLGLYIVYRLLIVTFQES
ncbi:hypothetical protein J40TS1_06610 [Paenibacillus montaniterrae]|uniref:Uncharacterized protein n=1 Tax=Paenibacillus montaniterrae TaxID=429341 RepID=A0A919YMT3_9BACL|nr:transposase [Paenibacillus montaniterrae]GIP15019.1 hypothetical protein J40TS1_06610 [Paenibacillus montaniterrae]